MSHDWLPIDVLWRGALAVVPAAVIVALVCRLAPWRPCTRHAMWLAVLAFLIATPLVPAPAPAAPQASPAVVPPPMPSPAPRLRPAPRPHPRAPIVVEGPRQPAAAPAPAPAPAPATTAVAPKLAAPTMPAPSAPGDEIGSRRASSGEPQRRDAPGASRAQAIVDRLGDQLRPWAVQLAEVRNAVFNLPPIPLAVWAGGFAALLVIAAIRIGRALPLIRAAACAPPSVVRSVADASRDLGLRRPPVTLMSEAPISPMLWCGRRPKLILPRNLWEQLDEAGRRAVIFHELAHLRRRDHWVCWIELIVGWVYWWHPVVWWVRRRLREEADLCCDAWVTLLLPESRRAYAQALLETRRLNSTQPVAVPAVGLGVTTARAKRFARRLTMVMTGQSNPRLSRKGTALVATLALVALVTTPIWACPDPPREPVCRPAKPEKSKAPKASMRYKLVVPSAPPAPPAPPAAGPDATTYEQFMHGDGDRSDASIDARLEQLEGQLEVLYGQLERLTGELNGLRGQGLGVGAVGMGAGSGARDALMYQALGMPGASTGDDAREPDGMLGICLEPGGPTIIRTYRLPEGKLEAIAELMVRGDVPVAVRQTDAGLEVHATRSQHCTFEAFCTMINGDDRVEAYSLSEGKLAALTELMVRGDVPILIEPGDTAIRVHGTDLEQAVFGAFVEMIAPGEATHASAGADATHGYARQLAELADRYESDASAQVAQLKGLRAAMRELKAQYRQVDRQAERLRQRAQELDDKADELEEEAEAIEEEAENYEGRKHDSLIARAEKAWRQAEVHREQAQALEAQADALEESADEIEAALDDLEEQIEAREEDEDDHGAPDDDDDWDDDDDRAMR